MPTIFNRASYTTSSTTSPFTIALSAGAVAATDDVKGYFIIEDADNKAAFANVVATITTGTTLTVDSIEYTTDGGGGLPTLTGTVNIYSALPISKYSDQTEGGMDGFIIIGDGNSVGYNGATYSNNGWNTRLDYADSNILMLSENNLVINAAHSATTADALVVDQVRVAEDPMPHNQTTGNIGPVDSIGFGIPFAKNYFYRFPGARKVVLIPAGDIASSINAGDYADSAGTNFGKSEIHAAKFTALDTDNRIAGIIISLGVTDADLAASAGFEAGLDLIITNYRVTYPDVPIVVCGLNGDTITDIGAEATTINASISSAPTRFTGVGYANPTSTSDATLRFTNAASQRSFSNTIYDAYVASFENVTL